MVSNDRLEKICEDAGVDPEKTEAILAEYTAICTRIDRETPKVELAMSKMTVGGEKIQVVLNCPNTDPNFMTLRRISSGTPFLVLYQKDYIRRSESESSEESGELIPEEKPEDDSGDAPEEKPYDGPVGDAKGKLVPEAEQAVMVKFNGPDVEYEDGFKFHDGEEFMVAHIGKRKFTVIVHNDPNPDFEINVQKPDWHKFTVVPEEEPEPGSCENCGEKKLDVVYRAGFEVSLCDDCKAALLKESQEEEPEAQEPTTEASSKGNGEAAKERPSVSAMEDSVFQTGKRLVDIPEGKFMPYTKFRVKELLPPDVIVIQEIPDISQGDPQCQGDGKPFTVSVELFDEIFAEN